MQFPFFNFKRKVKSQLTKATGGFGPAKPSPDELLGELFQDVQMRRIYPDGMTFVDLVPSSKLHIILKTYEQERKTPGFDLHTFVEKNFRTLLLEDGIYKTNPNHTIEEHIDELWDVLTRENYSNQGSLIALPYPYVVPGGRFGAMWYWDNYFIMLGLAASNRWELVRQMIQNYAFLLRKFDYIPSASRTYYIGRSQPPFFSHMLRLLAEKEGEEVLVKHLPYLLVEYRFWMKGFKQLHPQAPTYHRVMLMPNGSYLNRYYDNKRTPRPESYKEDVETAHLAPERAPSQVYLDLRAAAESGWDFSSRWFKDGKTIQSIRTTELAAVDLNSILYQLEQTIAEAYKLLKQPLLAKRYEYKMHMRRESILKYCWSEKDKFFFDYDHSEGKRTEHFTLAGIFPLYAQIATQEQAAAVAEVLKVKFLKDGGLLTTLVSTGQQWDAPNGWAPLHWIAIEGLRHYGYYDLAEEIKKRWIETNMTIYRSEGKLVEKYNVVHVGNVAGGGEYALQDGFGMTNGVLRALLSENT